MLLKIMLTIHCIMFLMTITKVVTYLDLLYSNSICRQSSMPTSIFMLLFISGYCDNVCTIMSCSLTESDKRFTIVTRKKYLLMKKYHNKQKIQMKKYPFPMKIEYLSNNRIYNALLLK